MVLGFVFEGNDEATKEKNIAPASDVVADIGMHDVSHDGLPPAASC